MPVDAAGPAQWAGGVWRSAACAGNQTYQSLKGGARPSCCSRWLRRRLQPCAGPAAVHGGATASSRHRPLVSCTQGPTDANAARERRVEIDDADFLKDTLVKGYKTQPAQAARTAREKRRPCQTPVLCRWHLSLSPENTLSIHNITRTPTVTDSRHSSAGPGCGCPGRRLPEAQDYLQARVNG